MWLKITSNIDMIRDTSVTRLLVFNRQSCPCFLIYHQKKKLPESELKSKRDIRKRQNKGEKYLHQANNRSPYEREPDTV